MHYQDKDEMIDFWRLMRVQIEKCCEKMQPLVSKMSTDPQLCGKKSYATFNM